MRNKRWAMMLVAAVGAASLLANAAMAAPDDSHGRSMDAKIKEGSGHADPQERTHAPGRDDSVTDDTYGPGHRGSIGLLKAWDHVKDTPAGDVISGLLKDNYNIDVMIDDLSGQLDGTDAAAGTDEASADATVATTALTKDQIKQLAVELKKRIEENAGSVGDEQTSLPKLVDLLAQTGAVQDAADVQLDVIHNDIGNLEAYVKRGQLLAKLGNKGVKTYVNGQPLASDVAPIAADGHTLVPFRAISSALKADVAWDEASQTVTVSRDGVVIKITLGSDTAIVDGREVPLDAPATTVHGRVMIPLRFISESFKANVQWDDETQSAVIVDSATAE